MLNGKRALFILSIIGLSFALVACTTAEDTSDIDPTQELLSDVSDIDTDNMMSEATDTSDYAGVVLTINDIINTETPDSAAAGTLQLDITLENTTDETIMLPFATEDYILTDPSGLNVVPTVISDDLLEIELESGASVAGVVEYAVVAPEASYIFTLGDFENIAINPVAE